MVARRMCSRGCECWAVEIGPYHRWGSVYKRGLSLGVREEYRSISHFALHQIYDTCLVLTYNHIHIHHAFTMATQQHTQQPKCSECIKVNKYSSILLESRLNIPGLHPRRPTQRHHRTPPRPLHLHNRQPHQPPCHHRHLFRHLRAQPPQQPPHRRRLRRQWRVSRVPSRFLQGRRRRHQDR